MIVMNFVSLLLLLSFSLCCSPAAACLHGQLRLTSNRTDQSHSAGSVELCYGSRWEPIHGRQWDDQDAEVACNQLGFTREGATAYHTRGYYTNGRQLSDFNCSGSELTLINCQFTDLGLYSSFNEDFAGVKCLLRKPCQPQMLPLSYQSTGTTSVSLSWTGCSIRSDRVAPAIKYLVSCANYFQIQRSTAITVNDLRPNKQYSCSVCGIDSLGRLGTTNTFSFTTDRIGAPKFAPYDFDYAFTSSNSVSLTWKPPPTDDRIGTITQYEIESRCQSCIRPQRYHVSSLTFPLSGLQSGKEYTFSIAACVEYNCGQAKSRRTVNVPPTATTATLIWRRPNEAKCYTIEVTNRNTSMSETYYIANPATTSTVINSLHPYHLYEFSIAAFTAQAKGPSESLMLRMPKGVPTGGPQSVKCDVMNLTTLTLNWSEPHQLHQNGPIEQYWIYVWNKDTDELVYNSIFKSVSSIQVTSLDPYHNYNCNVAAFARGGLGPFTTANVWLTDQADTSAPINLKPIKIGSESVHLHWLEPYTRNQHTTVQHYRITIQSTESDINSRVELLVQGTSYPITSLHPNYHYTITVEAVTLNTIGPIASINIQTEEDVPSESPKNLQATEVTTNSVTLNWDAPPLPSQNGAIIGYTVQVFQEEHITSILASRETSLAVTKLDDDTTYDFSVAANTSVGAGPYSVRVTAKTKNYVVEVVTYSLTGGCLLLVLILAFMVSCVVYHCWGSKLKRCTSKWFTKRSNGLQLASVNDLSEHGSRNDYNLRVSASWDDEEQTPELPNRDYLEDIDFVSKEFELFFMRPPDLPTRMDDNNIGDNSKNEAQVEVSCSKEQPDAIVEDHAQESGHYMSLKNAQEGSQSSASAYESLKPRKEQQPTAYENVKEESNTGSHYQPLMLAQLESKDYTSSHYQSLNLKLT